MRARAAAALILLPALLGGACSSRFPVNGERALERVRHQVAAGPRVPGSPGHAAVLHWMDAEMRRLGARVETQAVTDTSLGHPLPLVNLIAHFGPAGAPGSCSARIGTHVPGAIKIRIRRGGTSRSRAPTTAARGSRC